MSVIVKKFGGTSVANIDRIERIAEKIFTFYKHHPQIVVVVSAMEGETNKLENLAYQISDNPEPREMAALLATGEQVTISLLCIALIKKGCMARSYTGLQLGIETDSVFDNAKIKNINIDQIYKDLQAKRIVIVAGFQGVNSRGGITTLGRGGSDTTAVALAAVLNAKECHIYTDVDGVYTADPNIEPSAKKLHAIDFSEMIELAGLGAKVMQIRAVEIGSYYNIPIRVLSSFNDTDSCGTLIADYKNNLDYERIIKIAVLKEQVRVSIKNIEAQNIILILNQLADLQIQIDMLANINKNFSFVVNSRYLEQCNKILFSNVNKKNNLINYESLAKISLVGLGLASNSKLISGIYDILYRENINIEQIITAEIKVSILLNDIYLERAMKILHKAFSLTE